MMKFSLSRCWSSSLSLVLALAGISTVVGAGPLSAQDTAAQQVERIVMEPESLVIAVGERLPITVTVLDASGSPVADPDMMVWTQGAEVSVDQASGIVTGVRPGETVIETRIRRWAPGRTGYDDLKAYTHVVVRHPPVEQVEIDAGSGEIYVGTRERLAARASSSGGVREDAPIRWSSSDPEVLEVGPAGLVYANRTGTVRLTAAADGASCDTGRFVQNGRRQKA